MMPTKLQDRRNKGLCYNCDEKVKPGHRCKKLFVIEACLDEDDGDLIMEEDCEDENQLVETLEISLHAINGVRSAETMRIQGSLRQVAVYALIDSGSTHNFMSEKLAKKVCLKPQLGGNLRVTVASGEQLESPGAQWLCTLGPILWDFSKLQMKFNANNKEVTLQGLSILDNKVVNMNQIEVGNNVTIQTQLPRTSFEKLMPHPQAILDQRKQGKEVLVHWQGISPAEATWENLEFMKNQFPDFEDINTWGQVLALSGRK
ncbi:hypothetical protein F0562_006468 [Nyssa sinensis]|uniref:Chromo domain-containing protein n=1 Tax=Nyssa sinensis TaxID=561372 RepID=A0A5J5AL69_9ASTE|nr:hypothetical protein F0562_006468 [Nyssa sinensis]